MAKRWKMIVVAATAATCSALAVAPAATAQQNTGGGSSGASCTGPDGETYTNGSVYVTYIRVGKKLKTAYVYKCKDGKWEKVTI